MYYTREKHSDGLSWGAPHLPPLPPPYPPPPTPPPATPPAAPPPEAVTSLLIQSAGTAEERVAQLRLGRQLASAREELALLTAGLEGDELGGEMGMGLDAPVRRAAAQPLSIDAAVRYDGQRCAAAAVADAAAALSARVVAVGGVDAMGREGQPFPEGTQQRWHIRHGWQHRPGRGLPGGGGAGGGAHGENVQGGAQETSGADGAPEDIFDALTSAMGAQQADGARAPRQLRTTQPTQPTQPSLLTQQTLSRSISAVAATLLASSAPPDDAVPSSSAFAPPPEPCSESMNPRSDRLTPRSDRMTPHGALPAPSPAHLPSSLWAGGVQPSTPRLAEPVHSHPPSELSNHRDVGRDFGGGHHSIGVGHHSIGGGLHAANLPDSMGGRPVIAEAGSNAGGEHSRIDALLDEIYARPDDPPPFVLISRRPDRLADVKMNHFRYGQRVDELPPSPSPRRSGGRLDADSGWGVGTPQTPAMPTYIY